MLPVEGTLSSLSGIPTGVTGTVDSGVPKLLEGAKLAFIVALRQAFASTLTHKDLRYSSDKALTKLKIFAAHPITPEFFPALIISAASGDASIRYLGDDFVEEDIPEGKIKYSGQLSFTITVTAQTISTVEREKLIDHLIFYIRHLFRDVIRGFNLEYTKDIRIGGENITEVENRPVYEQAISIPCYLEYNSIIDQSSLSTLRTINLSDVDVTAVPVE